MMRKVFTLLLVAALAAAFQPVLASNGASQESVDALEAKADATSTAIDAIESKLDVLSTDIAAIEAKNDAIESKLDVLSTDIAAIEAKADVLEVKDDALALGLLELQSKVDALEVKLDLLAVAAELEFELEVQNACLHKHRKATLFLPAPAGKLADVKTIVQDAITDVGAVESVFNAQTIYNQGLTAEGNGQYKTAYQKFCTAYCIAVATASEVSACTQW